MSGAIPSRDHFLVVKRGELCWQKSIRGGRNCIATLSRRSRKPNCQRGRII